MQHTEPAPAFVGRESELRQLDQALSSAVTKRQPRFLLVEGDFGTGKTVLIAHFLETVAIRHPDFWIGRGKCAPENQGTGWIPFAQVMVDLLMAAIERGHLTSHPGTWSLRGQEAGGQGYDLGAVRDLLREAFTPEELWRLCRGHRIFSPVLDRVPQRASLEEIIDGLAGYCQEQSLFPELLSTVQAENPWQFERHRARLDRGDEPSPSASAAGPGSDRLAVLAQFVAHKAPAWRKILDCVIRLPGGAKDSDHSSSRPLGASSLPDELVRLQFSDVIKELAQEQPIVIWIDDLHWADESSLYLLSSLPRTLQSERVLVVATYRPVDALVTGRHASVFKQVHTDLVYRGDATLALSRGLDVADYVAGRFPDHTFPPQFISQVQEATEGHALWLRELFTLWQEMGVIVQVAAPDGAQEWRLAGDPVDYPVVPELGAVLEQRLEQISEHLQAILSRAAVEGDEFTAQTLSNLLMLDELDLYPDLARLEEGYKLILEGDQRESGGTIFDFFRFAHRFFRDYIYHRLRVGERRLLHRQVGECLERLCVNPEPVAGQLARHFAEARQPLRAARYALIAARAEQSRYAWAEAEQWCQVGLEQVANLTAQEASERQFDLLECSGDNFYFTGEYDLASERCWRAIAVAEQWPADPQRVAKLYALLADICDEQDQYTEGLDLVHRGKDLLDANGMPLCEAHLELLTMESLLMVRIGQVETAIELAHQVQADADRLPQTPAIRKIRAWGYNVLGIALGASGCFTEAAAMYEKMVDIGQAAGDEQLVAAGLANLADDLVWTGQFEYAATTLSRALQLARRVGDRPLQAYVLNTRGFVFLHIGDYAQAILDQEEALAIAGALRLQSRSSFAHADLALVHLTTSSVEMAVHHAHEARATADSERGVAYARDVLGQVEAARGRWAEAEEHFERAIALYDELDSHFAARARRHYAAALLSQGEGEKAATLLQDALVTFRELGLEYEIAQAENLLAQVPVQEDSPSG